MPPFSNKIPPPTPPASFASKVDAEAPPRAQAEAQEGPRLLTNRSGAQDFVSKQRRETMSLSTADTARRILNSLYTTDVFTYTDTSLIEWFRKDKFLANEATRTDAPFFSIPSLAALMLKDKPVFKKEIEDLQGKILTVKGPYLQEALVTLTERIVEHYKPSVPTTVKLAIYLVTNSEEVTDESLIGLDSGASKVGLITSFIENYYQVEDDELADFDLLRATMLSLLRATMLSALDWMDRSQIYLATTGCVPSGMYSPLKPLRLPTTRPGTSSGEC